MSDNGDFDVDDMKAALEAAINTYSETPKRGGDAHYTGRPTDNDEASARRQQHGFGARVDYNYEQKTSRSIARAARYEFSGDIGEVAPAIPELEKELYSKEFLYGKGDRMDVLEAAKIEVLGENPVAPAESFNSMGLHPVVLSNLTKCHYDHPTAIQRYVMPAVLQGRDIVVSAQTGSGKTVAYLAPVFSKLMGKATTLCAPKWNPTTHDPTFDRYRAEPLLLVVLPTRELAWQVFDECRRLCYRSMLRPCVAYGGTPIVDQREELRKGCDILIATPGRLKDFLRNPALLSLARVRYTIIDEADELMHDDWADDFQQLLNNANMNEDSDNIFMMFSATFPPEYRKIAKKYMSPDYLRIRAGRTGAAHRNVNQEVMWVDSKLKNQALWDVLMSHPPGRTMVFVNSKTKADIVDDFLYNATLPSAALHADRTQDEREDAIRGFREGTVPILVTTGVAARGIDIPNVMHVINYDLPSAMHGGIDEYVHRIGRTARLGHMGLAISFYNERNDDIGEELVKLLMETQQDIPEFLDEVKPAGGAVEYEEVESGEESDTEPAPVAATSEVTGGDAWGGAADGDVADAWGGAPANGNSNSHANGDSAFSGGAAAADDAW